jgi:uncharacterized metal-binding protein YceD (DUF177 family)
MANKRTYEIAFVGLKPGIHEFNYEVSDQFFVEKGATDFTNCTANIKLQLDKKSSFMLLKFEVGGKATTDCDRCGNPLPIDIWDEFNMVVKLVENPEEMNEQEEDPDVFYIAKTESHIDVANWIYEFVQLSIPGQKVCNEIGGTQCNKEVLAKLQAMQQNIETTPTKDIWKGLEQFKTKK